MWNLLNTVTNCLLCLPNNEAPLQLHSATWSNYFCVNSAELDWGQHVWLVILWWRDDVCDRKQEWITVLHQYSFVETMTRNMDVNCGLKNGLWRRPYNHNIHLRGFVLAKDDYKKQLRMGNDTSVNLINKIYCLTWILYEMSTQKPSVWSHPH